MRARIDHLVVTSPDLDRGVDWLSAALGEPPGPGGRHDRMGTHNRLLRLQDEVYLEVIAPDPSAPSPGRPRWFALDDLPPEAPPRLAAWVVRVDDLDAARDAAALDLCTVEPMSRGPWSWRLTVPVDGRQPLDGVAPVLIEWPPGRHPAAAMATSGTRLIGLTLHHPKADAVRALLARLGLDGEVAVVPSLPGAEPFLDALFAAPAGPVRLSCTRVHRP